MVTIVINTEATVPDNSSITITVIEEDVFGDTSGSDPISIDDGTNEYTFTHDPNLESGEFYAEIELDKDEGADAPELDSLSIEYQDDINYRQVKDELQTEDELEFDKDVGPKDTAQLSEEVDAYKIGNIELITDITTPNGTLVKATIKQFDNDILLNEHELYLNEDLESQYLPDAFTTAGEYQIELELISDVNGVTPEVDSIEITYEVVYEVYSNIDGDWELADEVNSNIDGNWEEIEEIKTNKNEEWED